MIRTRNSLHSNSSNNNNNNSNSNENMRHKRFTQSSVESATSATDSLTASTATLLGQQQQQEQQQQLQHSPLSPAKMATFKNSQHQFYASGQKLRSHQQPETAAAASPPPAYHQLRTYHYQASAFGAQHQQKRDYLKLQYPGAATRYNNVAAGAGGILVKPRENNLTKKQQEEQTTTTVTKKLLHGIRRPRQWFTAAAERSAIGGGGRSAEAQNYNEDNEKLLLSKAGIVDKGKSFIIEFLQNSSIHGFIYLAKIGLSIVERMIWFAFICIALFSIISLSKRTWERFQTSPMVISMDRNKLVWNTSFPSLTVCPHKRIDELKVEEYMDLHPEVFESDEDKDDFRVFIEKLAMLTYENIETLPINKTFGIPSDKYLDILYELKWNFEPEMSSGAAVQMYIYESLTEFGICHSVNSLVARYNSYDYWRKNEWNILDHGDRVTVHPLDGEIYAQIINLSTAYDVYFHGAGDIPNISKQRYTFPESDYTTVELIALEIYTAEDARAFTTKQRKCRFQYEAEDMLTAPIYSFGLCLAECRMFFAMKVCGCVPHFYRNRLRNGRVLPVCGFKGLACLQDIKLEIISLKSNRHKIDCNCLSNCDDSNFFVQSYRSRVWFLGANLQWGIIDYPKMQLRRDVLFSFADVLVYIGGLVGFFLGCSALSITEVVYYFTVRFIRRMLSK